MRYVKVAWEHDFVDEPVLYLSELGGDGYEIRKVQFYRDGRSEWADESHETANSGLAEIPFPPLEEISGQEGLSAEWIDREEFERAWGEAQIDY
ncbi:hypothetical protein SAMN04487904_107165 [Actinopolyspora lacussalsi subsp. righensis]|uniref:DUF6881 domain-containing protein n=1 Tax=Actinopolyspora righensis TaxID=995060 RepID=A0A1I7AKU7_9ACTN|nr:hypothetical protein [Actinopolyspora righensis]SFT75494.1 hypothetical protein SAMN04487904_107165 [Actinopolyspora righensis]